jgi:hypothetical protein
VSGHSVDGFALRPKGRRSASWAARMSSIALRGAKALGRRARLASDAGVRLASSGRTRTYTTGLLRTALQRSEAPELRPCEGEHARGDRALHCEIGRARPIPQYAAVPCGPQQLAGSFGPAEPSKSRAPLKQAAAARRSPRSLSIAARWPLIW